MIADNRLLPWSDITITPDLKAIIGIGRMGIFIYHWPYEGLAFCDEGIVFLENPVSQEKNLAPGLPGLNVSWEIDEMLNRRVRKRFPR